MTYARSVGPLGKGGTFAGQHIRSSKLGAAVQINAFNFPVWGMLEKFAPAFLAGMPSVVKPARPLISPRQSYVGPSSQACCPTAHCRCCVRVPATCSRT